MAELADAADSKSAEGNLMGVRFPLPAPYLDQTRIKQGFLTLEKLIVRLLLGKSAQSCSFLPKLCGDIEWQTCG
jgi:hypothetical protein